MNEIQVLANKVSTSINMADIEKIIKSSNPFYDNFEVILKNGLYYNVPLSSQNFLKSLINKQFKVVSEENRLLFFHITIYVRNVNK